MTVFEKALSTVSFQAILQNANCLFNVVTLGVVTQPPETKTRDFGGKVFFFFFFFFCGGRKSEKNPQSEIEINQSQSTYESRIEPVSQQ